jgi:hypothetical protein
MTSHIRKTFIKKILGCPINRILTFSVPITISNQFQQQQQKSFHNNVINRDFEKKVVVSTIPFNKACKLSDLRRNGFYNFSTAAQEIQNLWNSLCFN